MESDHQFNISKTVDNKEEFKNVASFVSLINRNNGKLIDSSNKESRYSLSRVDDLPPPDKVASVVSLINKNGKLIDPSKPVPDRKIDDLPPPDGMHSRVGFMRQLHERKSGKFNGIVTTEKNYAKIPPPDLPPPDGIQSRVEHMRLIHEGKVDSSNKSVDSKPLTSKMNDLPPLSAVNGVQSRVESMRLIYEKKNEEKVPVSPSQTSTSSRRLSLSNAVERLPNKHNKRISYPVDIQNSSLPPRTHHYNPQEYQQQVQTQRRHQQQQQYNQYNNHQHRNSSSSSHHYADQDPNRDQDIQYEQYHKDTRNVTVRIKHYEKRGRAGTQEIDRRDSFQDNSSKHYYEKEGVSSYDVEKEDSEEIADIMARGYDIQTAKQIQKLGMKNNVNQRRVSTSNLHREPSHQDVQVSQAVDQRKGKKVTESRRLSLQHVRNLSASPTLSVDAPTANPRQLDNSFSPLTHSIKNSPRKMSGAEAGSQRYSPIQENAATKPASRPTSRASDGKIQDDYAEPSTPISKADTKPSPLSQNATRIYHARVRRQSEKDKQPANDREISLSFQDLPSVSGLSSPSKQQQPTTPLHVRRKMLSHATFIKKKNSPDPAQCGDSEEDYGELGPFSITGEPGINLKLEDMEDVSFDDNSSGMKDNGTEQSSYVFHGKNAMKRFGSNEFPTKELHTTHSLHSITSSITLESFANLPTDDEVSEMQSHKVIEEFDEEDKITTELQAAERNNSASITRAGVVPVFTIYDELEIRRIMSEDSCTLTEATETYYYRRQQQSTQSSMHSSIQDPIRVLLSEQEALYGFNMYDMILPGDHAEIITIRERLNCDLDTAILTIFERRNLLIKSFSNEPSRDGPRTYPSTSLQKTGKRKNKCGYDHEGYEEHLPQAPATLVPPRNAEPAPVMNHCNEDALMHYSTMDRGDKESCNREESIPTEPRTQLVSRGSNHLNSPGSSPPSMEESRSVGTPHDYSPALSPSGASTQLCSPGESVSAISGTESGVTSNESSDHLATVEDSNTGQSNHNAHSNSRINSLSRMFSLKKLFFPRSTRGGPIPDTHTPRVTTASAISLNLYEEAAVRRLYGYHTKDVRRLVKMGFAKDQAVQALIECDNNVEHAANVLARTF